MRKDQRKLEKKRRKKQEEKKRLARQSQTLAYTGNKYKTEELIQTLMNAEIGIYETYVMTDRKLLDQTVRSALETLIRQLRRGPLPPRIATDEIQYEIGREDDLVIENIRRNWADHFATAGQPSRDKLVGVLRTMLGSVEAMKSPGSQSQSYLKHLVGFLTKQLGITVHALSADQQPLPEPKEDDLVLRGRQWYMDGDRDARAEFFELASELRRRGHIRRVIDACHLLIGEVSDTSSEVVAELMKLSLDLQKSLVATIG